MAIRAKTFDLVRKLKNYRHSVKSAYSGIEVLGSEEVFQNYMGIVLGSPEEKGLDRKVRVYHLGNEVCLEVQTSGIPLMKQEEDVCRIIEEQGGLVKLSQAENERYHLNFVLPLAK